MRKFSLCALAFAVSVSLGACGLTQSSVEIDSTEIAESSEYTESVVSVSDSSVDDESGTEESSSDEIKVRIEVDVSSCRIQNDKGEYLSPDSSKGEVGMNVYDSKAMSTVDRLTIDYSDTFTVTDISGEKANVSIVKYNESDSSTSMLSVLGENIEKITFDLKNTRVLIDGEAFSFDSVISTFPGEDGGDSFYAQVKGNGKSEVQITEGENKMKLNSSENIENVEFSGMPTAEGENIKTFEKAEKSYEFSGVIS